jgi:hypothetical protein
MVRGIYQTSDAGNRPKMVAFGISVALVMIVVACLFKSVLWAGDCVCDMPGYWNAPYSGYTYSHYARQALDNGGYGYDGVSDKGDWPKGEYCGLSKVRVRRFVVTGLRGPGGSVVGKAEVFIKFDGKNFPVPVTTVESYNVL